VNEILDGQEALNEPVFMEAQRTGRDREDMADYKVKISAAFAFSNRVNRIEYYHNSSWLEHGGAPEKRTSTNGNLVFVRIDDLYQEDRASSQEERRAR
jgi:DNA gyrase subunit B